MSLQAKSSSVRSGDDGVGRSGGDMSEMSVHGPAIRAEALGC